MYIRVGKVYSEISNKARWVHRYQKSYMHDHAAAMRTFLFEVSRSGGVQTELQIMTTYINIINDHDAQQVQQRLDALSESAKTGEGNLLDLAIKVYRSTLPRRCSRARPIFTLRSAVSVLFGPSESCVQAIARVCSDTGCDWG